MLQFLLLIVGIYLSIMFTFFFIVLMEADKEKDKLKASMKKRDIKLDKILHLCYKIDTKNYLESKNTKTN